MNIPGVFWVILIVILVPALIPVLQQAFPSSTYAWSAVIVVVLAAIAKTTEIVYKKQIDKAVGQTLPAAMARPIGGGEYEHDAVTPPAAGSSTVVRWLVG
jgi:hypothetical protein